MDQTERDQLVELSLRLGSTPTSLNTPSGPITVQRPASISNREMLAQTRALLGEEKYQRLMDLRPLDLGLDFTGDLAKELYRHAPLNSAQVKFLLETFVQASEQARKVSGKSHEGWDWDAITKAVKPILSQDQLATFEDFRRRKEGILTD